MNGQGSYAGSGGLRKVVAVAGKAKKKKTKKAKGGPSHTFGAGGLKVKL